MSKRMGFDMPMKVKYGPVENSLRRKCLGLLLFGWIVGFSIEVLLDHDGSALRWIKAHHLPNVTIPTGNPYGLADLSNDQRLGVDKGPSLMRPPVLVRSLPSTWRDRANRQIADI